MVEWTDAEREAIQAIWAKVQHDKVGPEALGRAMIVYPWTQRYFKTLGTFTNAASIFGNEKVAKQAVIILHGIDRGVQNLDNLKATYADLSVLHSDTLHVDPDNFRLFGDCITIVLAAQMGPTFFTAERQAAWQKFVSVVISAMSKQYH
ncbi:hypothetical protein AAFF_G00160690 [Aldrovandia affinis]|uniref:Globin domain-containing protein n=1 Tax=Aldrovandia affinis TaxID=143900 RepID=A0AAD7RMW8_9TELE|nr:hypothetical protein AAFF_G00160690 [Aldrovandia affinis]